MIINSFLDDLRNTLEQNPHLVWVVVGCVGALLILVILLIVLSCKKRSNTTEEQEKKLIQETLEENNEPAVEAPVEEVVALVEEQPVEETEAPVVEEKPEVKKPRKKAVKTVDSEEIEAEEKPEAKKPRKKTVKTEEVAEEPVVEEVTVEETPTKKTRVVYGKYEVYSDGTSYFYTLKASNGEVLIKSEAYASKDSVLLAIEAIKRNVEAGSIKVRQDKHGLYQFVLTAKNHRTLVMSANYTTEKRATSASESFKRFAATSPVVELTEIVESTREEIKVENIVDKKGGKIGLVATEGGFYYVLKASNGEVLVHSDTYKTQLSAESAMKRFQEAVFSGKFYVEKDKRDNYQFKLFSSNGRIVCVGQIYATKALAIASVNSVCSFVKLATTLEI